MASAISLGYLLLQIADDTVRAPAGNRDEYVPSEGRLLDSTTSDEVFVGTGTEWVNVVSALTAAANQGGPAADPAAGSGPIADSGAPQDLTATDGDFDGQTAVHDGTGSPSRGLAEWRDSDNNWYSYVDNALFGAIA